MLQKLAPSHWISLSIVGFISTASIGIITILPLILGELSEQYEFSKSLIGWFASINIAGIAVGGLTTAFLIQKMGMLRLVRIGLLGLMVCELASIFMLDSPYLLGMRLVAGIFGGIGYASSLGAFATLEKPVKGYGLYVLVFCGWSAVVFPFLPYFLHKFGLEAGFILLAGMAFIALLLSSVLKAFKQKKAHAPSFQLSALVRNPLIWLVLFAYYTLQTSGGAIWAYIELIGEAKMISENFIANMLAFGNIVTIPFALAIYWINDKIGFAIPIFGGLAIFITAAILIYFTSNPWLYGISTISYLGIWAFLIAFYQGIQAQYDPEGKVVALGAFINMMGQATGPAIAAMFLGNQPYVYIIGLALVGLVLSLLSISKSVLDLSKKENAN